MHKFDEIVMDNTDRLVCSCGHLLKNFQIRDFDNKLDKYKIGKKDRRLYRKVERGNLDERNAFGFPVFKNKWKHIKITTMLKGYNVCTHCKNTWLDLTMYIENGILKETILVVTKEN